MIKQNINIDTKSGDILTCKNKLFKVLNITYDKELGIIAGAYKIINKYDKTNT